MVTKAQLEAQNVIIEGYIKYIYIYYQYIYTSIYKRQYIVFVYQ